MSQLQMSSPVVSGMPYLITAVAGQPPTGLTDFIGSAVTFTAQRNSFACVVVGDGVAWGHDVRFNEKAGAAGRDVRVWDISVNDSDHTFQARTTSAI